GSVPGHVRLPLADDECSDACPQLGRGEQEFSYPGNGDRSPLRGTYPVTGAASRDEPARRRRRVLPEFGFRACRLWTRPSLVVWSGTRRVLRKGDKGNDSSPTTRSDSSGRSRLCNACCLSGATCL